MDKTSKASGRVLLSSDVVPTKYTIKIEPNLQSFTFDGEEKIEVEVKKSDIREISLHSREIYIKDVSYTSFNGQKFVPEEVMFNEKLKTCTFIFKEDLPAGLGVLEIVFMGHLNNQMAGFYRSKYVDANGNSKFMASTQFESLDARRCFPCWDEPALKAVFAVTLIVPIELQAFSNMPEKEVNTLQGGRKEIIFLESPRMSTYLLAFCVGEFDFVQAYNEHGVLVRVYTPPGKSATGLFALSVACRCLDHYNNFFQLPYPLPKLDMVAIPEFAAGAMENWGLVTYRQVDLLIDENQASSQQKQRVCSVVAHELAHQWFGNLVTMAWWDDLWLNEGFACWSQTFAADHLFPEWKMWDQFTVVDQARALVLDSLRTSHPIQVPIAHAEEVEQVFDAISYAKGACVVKMLAAVLGEDLFRSGLQLYMNRHRYSNTETFHLWGAWQEVSGKPIEDIMKSWTEQMGHPVVEVVSDEWSADKVVLTLKQGWFLQDGTGLEDEKLWQVPLLIGSKGLPSASVNEIMTTRTFVIEVPLDSSVSAEAQWVKLNYGQHIPTRVKYSHAMLQKLASAVSNHELPVSDRVGLLLDTHALVKAGMLSAVDLMLLLKAYSGETNASVWEALGQTLLALEKAFINDEFLHQKLSAFASSLILPAFSTVGWEPQPTDGHLTKLLRATLVGLLARFSANDPAVVAEAKRRYDIWLVDPTNSANLPSEYKVAVWKIILQNGDEKEFNEVLAYYENAELASEKQSVLTSMGFISSAHLKKKVLEWTMSDKVKIQDFFYPMGSVAQSNGSGLNISWEFFQSQLPAIKEKLKTATPMLMDAVILFCCSGFSTDEKAEEIQAFFEANPLPNNTRKISNLIETVRVNAAFLNRLKSSDVNQDAFWEQLSK